MFHFYASFHSFVFSILKGTNYGEKIYLFTNYLWRGYFHHWNRQTLIYSPGESTVKQLPAEPCLTLMFDSQSAHLLTDQASAYQDVAARTDRIQVIPNTEPTMHFAQFFILGLSLTKCQVWLLRKDTSEIWFLLS